jgi:hypothetical protein
VVCVNDNLDENVQSLHGGLGYRDQTAVSVVDHEIAVQSLGSVIIDTAGSVGDVSQNDNSATTKPFKNFSQKCREQLKTLGQLESHALCVLFPDLPNGLEDLEIVITGQETGGVLQLGVLKDFGGDLVEQSGVDY